MEKLKVYIVEDEKEVREGLRYLLNLYSEIKVLRTFSSAEDLFRDIESGRSADIILMDMQMPVMNGYDATEQLRSAKCDVPILALTANAMQGDSDKCIRSGCDCHIPKPLDQGYLINVIKKYLKSGRNKGKATADKAQ